MQAGAASKAEGGATIEPQADAHAQPVSSAAPTDAEIDAEADAAEAAAGVRQESEAAAHATAVAQAEARVLLAALTLRWPGLQQVAGLAAATASAGSVWLARPSRPSRPDASAGSARLPVCSLQGPWRREQTDVPSSLQTPSVTDGQRSPSQPPGTHRRKSERKKRLPF